MTLDRLAVAASERYSPAGASSRSPGSASAADTRQLLGIDNLSVTIPSAVGVLRPVDQVSLVLERGATLGLVGESGSGKSMLVRSILGITPATAEVSGSIWFDGIDVCHAPVKESRTVWGRRVSLVFQDSMTSLNPVVRVGRQIGESARIHLGLSRAQTKARALELLDLVGIPDAKRRAEQYPHQLSGGMRQRVAIAMALACDPELLIADEATTALDVTVQQQILDLLQEIQRDRHMAMIIVSHDLSVVASRTDRIAVMYGGRIAEIAPTKTLFAHRRHQYTQALLGALPSPDLPRHSQLVTVGGSSPNLGGKEHECRFAPRCPAVIDRCRTERPKLVSAESEAHRFACFVPVTEAAAERAASPAAGIPAELVLTSVEERPGALLRVDNLVASFKVRGGTVQAVAGVSFDIMPGETLGLVGESGCGKSTTARTLVQLPPQKSGSVRFEGKELNSLSGREMRRQRSRIQIVLQDPIASLNPRRTVRASVAEGLLVQGASREEATRRVDESLRDVGIDPYALGEKKPFQLSGGQCQRVAIARAIVLRPSMLICDEPVSSLDVSVRAQVLNLLERIKDEHGLSMLFVSHDLGVVRNISDRVAVMYLGKIVEIGDADVLYSSPSHPYTRALIDAVPDPDPTAEPSTARLIGQLPSPLSPPSGCRFRTRCPHAQQLCEQVEPELTQLARGQVAACHFPLTGS